MFYSIDNGQPKDLSCEIMSMIEFRVFLQAEVAGQRITWLTPHVLSQTIPDDVDIRVMLTFVEFYEVFHLSNHCLIYIRFTVIVC